MGNYKLTKRGLEIKEFPLAKELQENAKGRIYLKGSLQEGVKAFHDLVDQFPYYRLIPDGHVENEEHKFSVVVGMIDDMYYEDLQVFVDVTFFKGSQVFELIKSTLDAGGVISMSMEALTFGKYTTRMSAKEVYEEVEFLPDHMGQNRLFIVERALIFGASLVDAPSFKDSYVKVKEGAPSLVKQVRECVGPTCSVFIREGARLCPRVERVRNRKLIAPNELKNLTKADLKEILNYLTWAYGRDKVLEVFDRAKAIFMYGANEMRILRRIHELIFDLEPQELWLNLILGALYMEFDLVLSPRGLKLKWNKDLLYLDKGMLQEVLQASSEVIKEIN